MHRHYVSKNRHVHLSAGFYERLKCVQSTRPWRSYYLRTAQDGLVGSVPGENGFLSHCAHIRIQLTRRRVHRGAVDDYEELGGGDRCAVM